MHRDEPGTIISHANVAPWHVVVRDGRPVALIGWEYAGPVVCLEEVAATGRYCAQLHDDDVAEMVGLPAADVRARWLRAFLDGYQLPRYERVGLINRMVEWAVRDTAASTRHRGITADTDHADPTQQWMTWQLRAADWMLRHRALLQSVIESDN